MKAATKIETGKCRNRRLSRGSEVVPRAIRKTGMHSSQQFHAKKLPYHDRLMAHC